MNSTKAPSSIPTPSNSNILSTNQSQFTKHSILDTIITRKGTIITNIKPITITFTTPIVTISIKKAHNTPNLYSIVFNY